MTRDEALADVMQKVSVLAEQNSVLSERVAELEVQSRFTMMLMKVPKPGQAALAGPDGKTTISIVDGHVIFNEHGGREMTLAILEAEYIEQLAQVAALEKKQNGDPRPFEEIVAQCEAEHRAASAARRARNSRPDLVHVDEVTGHPN